MNILTFCICYLPGYKGGGPVKSIAGLVERLGDEFQFHIVTTDRDLGDDRAYPNIEHDRWNLVGKAKVFYLAPEQITLRFLHRLLNNTSHDIVYLNSMFSPGFTIRPLLLRRLGLVPKTPMIAAPRGELSPGALVIKAKKKRYYLAVARMLDLYRDVTWQVSSEHERDDLNRNLENIVRTHGNKPKTVVAPDLVTRELAADVEPLARQKAPGTLNAVFLSRISRMKNLEAAIEALGQVTGTVRFDIYGPLEDQEYWRDCQQRISRLPASISVQYRGSVEPDNVIATLSRYELFILLTHGENFGYVILEALTAGCPVLISDRTAWRDLESLGVGWDLPLEDPDRLVAALQRCVDMNGVEFNQWSVRAREHAQRHILDETATEQNRRLFFDALASGLPAS
jgi:glycosyltransferase involved in cell wall biosynthesis